MGRPILDVARENGIDIPTLCHLDGLTVVAACRLCVVEIAGSSKLTPACATLVAEGMEVTTHSEQLAEYRRTITEMLFLERNHICAVCVANNHCELQDLAERPAASTTSSCPWSTRTSASTPATRCSPSTTTAASCASAACGSATRSRAPTPGT